MKKLMLALLGLNLVGCVPYMEGGSEYTGEEGDGGTITSFDDIGREPSQKASISGVWRLAALQCDVQSNAMIERDIDEPFVQASRIVVLPEVRANYEITVPPGRQVAVKLVKDQSRGLEDHYILLSEGETKPAYGAIVVTKLPGSDNRPERIFPFIEGMQEKNAGKSLAAYKSIVDTKHGQALEFIVPGRTSGLCFPTAPYVSDKESTVTISRFVLQQDRLVEFSIVLEVPEDTSPGDATDSVRVSMDEFMSGFSSI